MKLLYHLIDDQYAFKSISKTRDACRGIVLNEHNQICLSHLLAVDGFGRRNYYEIPGGGRKEDESHEEAVIREINEELGLDCQITYNIGIVHDYYNLIKQENYSYYYLLKINKVTKQHLEERENRLIDKFVWVDIDSAIRNYQEVEDKGVGLLVKRRELPILKLIKSYLTEINNEKI